MTNQFLRFHIAKGLFAVEINQIAKVIKVQDITQMKKGPNYVLGIAQIDEEKVIIINLRKIFGFLSESESSLAILTDLNGNKLAFQVDSIDGVFKYHTITEPPKNIKTPRFFTGVVAGDEQIIQVVEFNKILDKRQRSLLLKIMKGEQ